MTMRNWVQHMPSIEAYWINRILYEVQHDRAEEKRYFEDPAAYIARFDQLGQTAIEALTRTDIGRLYLLGANPYLLRTYCLQLRIPEADYLAALRAVADEVING